jgi:glycosyltransferase involved in cell wall biosynthesis
LVTLSTPARDAFVGLGFARESITVVPPGVDGRFSPGGTRSPTPLVLTVGRLWPQKRVHLVVEAMARLRDQHPSAELVVVGDGPCRPDLEALAQATGARVRFAGRVDEGDLVELYRRAWVVASASFGEGWGMTVTEAAACATPAVVSVNTGHSEAVVHGDTGLLVDMGKAPDTQPSAGGTGAGDGIRTGGGRLTEVPVGVEAMVAGLDRALGDAGSRERWGRNAVARARHLDWDRVAARVLGVLTADAERREQASRGRVRKAGYQGVPAVAPTSRR